MNRAPCRWLACLAALSVFAGGDARGEVVWHGANCGAPTPSGAAGPAGDEPRVDIDVVQHGDGWVAAVTARYPSGASGTRHIEAASCAELERAVAVSLSLLEPADAATSSDGPGARSVARSNTLATNDIARGASAAGPDRAAPPALSSDAGSSVAGEPPVDTGAGGGLAARAGEARHGFVRLASLLGSGGGRFAELGAALSGGLWLGRWGGRVELGARRTLSSISAERGVSLELTRVAAALEACGRSGAWLDWGLCAGPRLELVSGLASGPSDPARDVVALPGMGAGGFLRIPIASRWALSSELQGAWALRGAEANVRPWGRVYELPRLGASLLVGVEWEL